MSVVKQYAEVLKKNISSVYDVQHDKIVEVANLFGDCMSNGGVVQLFGVKHGIETVNELNYRAGGIAYFHKYAIMDLAMRHIITKNEVYLTQDAYNHPEYIDELEKYYQLDPRDLYCIISEKGNEPIAIELAKKAKERGQKVVAFVNKKSYDHNGGTLLDYADCYLDWQSEDPDLALNINGVKCCQTNTSVLAAIGQMLHCEIYRYFMEKEGKAPVLLSANIKGADVHNNALTDPYERRIR